MKRVAIIGGGFAGLAAARVLARHSRDVQVTLLDGRDTSDFLPLLPDVVGGRVAPDAASVPLAELLQGMGVEFVRDQVRAVDPAHRRVEGARTRLEYDRLIVACGSVTNCPAGLQRQALVLDGVRDALAIAGTFPDAAPQHAVIVGGGYTGVEIASNLWRLFRRRGTRGAITLVEATGGLLPALPAWVRDHVMANLGQMGVRCVTNCRLDRVDGSRAVLSNGEVIDPAALIWTAGVRLPDFAQALIGPASAQRRIPVDRFLRFSDEVFVAGDAALFLDQDQPLRMCVLHAARQGEAAAANILRGLRDEPLREFKPLDPGYVLPLANGRSCGTVLGANLKGPVPTWLHYVMCAYRSQTWRNKRRVLGAMLRG